MGNGATDNDDDDVLSQKKLISFEKISKEEIRKNKSSSYIDINLPRIIRGGFLY